MHTVHAKRTRYQASLTTYFLHIPILRACLLGVVLFWFAGSANAQTNSLSSTHHPPASVSMKAVEIIHNPNASASFWTQVFLDRAPDGSDGTVYHLGEMLRVGVTVSEAAYVYLFVLQSNGVVRQLLPNRFDGHGNNHVQAGATTYFPPAGASYGYRVSEPLGLDKFFVVASKSPLTSSTLTGFQYEGAFASIQEDEARFGSRVLQHVSPLQQDGWVTDVVNYQVVP